MTQPNPASVIYLPPGVTPQQSAPPPQAGPQVPFDRHFFAEQLPRAIKSFCEQVECESPSVEVMTVDGTRHYVNGISGVSDQWVALHASRQDHEHPIELFLPYGTIFRVEIHPESDGRPRRLGFLAAREGRRPPSLGPGTSPSGEETAGEGEDSQPGEQGNQSSTPDQD